MKGFKFLFVIGTIAVIMSITGCAISTTASLGTKSLQQDNAVINDIIGSIDDSQGELET